MRVALALVAIFGAASANVTRYDGYKVYEVQHQNDLQGMLLKSLEHNDYDFWSEIRKPGYPTTIMVSPGEQSSFEAFLVKYGIPYRTTIEDVEKALANETARQAAAPRPRKGRISFQAYNTVPEIEAYLQQLASDYPELVSLESIGDSYEGQPVYVLKISTGGSNKPVILVDAGIHAREWIAPAEALYIIQELVENANNRGLIENVDWHIIPVLNPDGYRFTYTDTRLWRKTRSPGRLCYGVDGNRNFDFHWMETGASSSECSEIYAGSEPFSEPETAALAAYVQANADRIKLYLTFHSYGQYLLYPWGYTSALPEDAGTLHALATRVEAAIASYSGTRYTIGSSTNVLYAAAGGSDDWVKAVGGVALSYTIELPGGGSYGFDLPASRILPVVIETFEGVKEYHAYIEENFARKKE